jgi:hypothetical protein
MTQPPTAETFWLPVLLPVLLILVVYRLTRLVTRDDFPPVLWVRDRVAGGWRPLSGKERERYYASTPTQKAVLSTDWSFDSEAESPQRYVRRAPWSPHWLAELATCPWCASGWISGAVVLATDVTVGLPVPWLYGVAVWGAAALLGSREWA